MDEPFDKYLEGLSERRTEELRATELLWELYVQAIRSLIDALDRDIHDTSAALLLQCMYRLREHLLSLPLVHVRAFPSSAEALSRVVVETSVNVAYLCLGERLERFNEYFAHYIEQERSQNLKWQSASNSISAAGGNQESIRILDAIFAGPLGTVEIASTLLYSAGFVIFAIAIWRSGALPGWAGVLMAAHAPPISGPFSVVGSVAGTLLALVGGGWIALGALRGTPGQDRARMPRAR